MSDVPEPPQVPDRMPAGVALLVAGAFFMEIFDGTVVSTAAPAIARSFEVTSAQIGVCVTAYLVTVAALIPLSGWLADRFGSRRTFVVAIAVFTAASVLCAASDTLVELSLARVLQGVGGALMVPVGRLVVLRNVAKADVIRAMSYLVWPALVAPILAPVVAGVLTTYASWRWIFLVNLPLGLAALGVALKVMPSSGGGLRRPLDRLGFVGLALSFGGVVYLGVAVAEPDVAWLVVSAATLAVVLAGTATVRHLGRSHHPLLSLGSLRLRTFRVANASGSAFRAAMSAVPFLLPLMFQDGFGWTPARAGTALLFLFAGNLAIKPLTTPMVQRMGFRVTLVIATTGAMVSVASCAALRAGTPLAVLGIVLALGGAFRSIGFTAYNTLAFADIEPAMMSGANTLASTLLQLSMGLGIAVAVTALRAGNLLYGGTPAYSCAFVLVALVIIGPFVVSLRLPSSAGNPLRRP